MQAEITTHSADEQPFVDVLALLDGASTDEIGAMNLDGVSLKDITDSLMADSMTERSSRFLYAIVAQIQKNPANADAVLQHLRELYCE